MDAAFAKQAKEYVQNFAWARGVASRMSGEQIQSYLQEMKKFRAPVPEYISAALLERTLELSQPSVG